MESNTCISPLATRPILYTDTLNGVQTCRDDLWAVTTEELNAAARAAPGVPAPICFAYMPGETRRIVIASDEQIDGERVLCIAIDDVAAPSAPAGISQQAGGAVPVDRDSVLTALGEAFVTYMACPTPRNHDVLLDAIPPVLDAPNSALAVPVQADRGDLTGIPGARQCDNCIGRGVIYQCVVCGSDEPRTGTCSGPHDPRSLCATLAAAPAAPLPVAGPSESAKHIAEQVRAAVHSIIGPGFYVRLAELDIASIIVAATPVAPPVAPSLTDEQILDATAFVKPAAYGLPTTGPDYAGYDVAIARAFEKALALPGSTPDAAQGGA